MSSENGDDHNLSGRVSALESWRHETETKLALQEVSDNYAKARFDNVEKRLDNIDSHISKVVWLILTAIIGAFMAFLVSGGFNLG